MAEILWLQGAVAAAAIALATLGYWVRRGTRPDRGSGDWER